jgi:hypothetical protein
MKTLTKKIFDWDKICIIFDELNIFNMKNYKRIIYKAGTDIGIREDNRGAIFIEPRIYFRNSKIQAIIKTMSDSNIVKRETSKK